ncbi:hypothetical protein RDV89_00840 [Nocardioides zeae]|uniref:Uncharacterized protein n=1 Tax=Nocardioides imazamoxiresistens TaxID=3231893 RepID=A0ABU3PQU6_9ACTN|nr:hypothetical protein [Nocardioides zeae]MDT9591592.1 hypothetical protein [Nocardioides zeae]
MLQPAFEACDSDDVTEVMDLADEGRSVLIDTRSEHGATLPVRCLFQELGTSAGLVSRVSTTNALMGSQEAQEGSFTYTWSYHPDTGLSMVVTEQSQPD